MDKVWGAKLEETQNKLQTAESELTTLKQMTTHMLTAITGKFNTCFSCTNSSFLLSAFIDILTRLSCITGNRAASIPKDFALKLKDLYLTVRQLYFGSCEIIKATRGFENPPRSMHEVIGHLSTTPAWLEQWKRSACRAGLMRGLALAKAYHPNIDPSPLMKGFPQFNTDGTPFDKRCYSRVVKQTWHAATEIAKTLKLASIQNGYNANNEKIFEDEPPRVDLLQSYSNAKESGSSTAQAAPSDQANPEDEEENIFESLVSATWKQDIAGKGPVEAHDPASTAQASSARTEDLTHSAA